MRVIELPNADEEAQKIVQETVDSFKEHAKECKGVLLIGLTEDGTPSLYFANLNQIERCYLGKALDAWLTNWFCDWERPEGG